MSLLYAGTGLIGGMSSVFTTVWSYFSRASFFQQARFVSSRGWRFAYAGGLVLGAALWLATLGSPNFTHVPAWQLAVGGFVAGFGARLSGGCTSGHGICGTASLQPASMLAVAIFLSTGMLTAHLVRAFG